MTYSTQSRHGLSLVPEMAYGVTPVSPAMTRLRHTGCDLALTKTTIESDEIREDRQISHLIPGQHSARGDVEFELNYGGVDDLLAAVCYSDWSANILKTGTDQSSFTFERAFNDIGQYQHFTGCVMDEMTLSLQPQSLVTGRFSVRGKSMTQTDSPLDASIDAGSTNRPMDSYTGALKEGGFSLALVAGLDLKIENGAEQVFVLGEETANGSIAGRSRVSGELTAYFEDAALINKFIDKTNSSLEVSLSGEGGSYDILLPNILYTGADAPVRGDKVVTLSLPFVALYDAPEATNIKITRTAA